MSETAILAKDLSKLYRIGERQPYKALRDTLSNAIYKPFRKVANALRGRRPGQGAASPRDELIWAVRDCSFEIQKGQVVGIIGRNGAGKTTLLKVLSRITEPTEGYAEIRGRVNSLLEVGTGFHPELSGRENIFLNAAILGMKKSRINEKFDEIVSFAEIGKFIDTPVKRYSSGMYVRLAFSVAAHLEPDILLVDEVLAVGDVSFQQKCLGKMEEVTQEEGRTVLFVSHSMASISSLTKVCMWMDEGRLVKQGPTAEVVESYVTQSLSDSTAAMDVADIPRRQPSGKWARELCFRSVRLFDGTRKVTNLFFEGQPITMEVILESTRAGSLGEIFCFAYTASGVRLFGAVYNGRSVTVGKGLYRASIVFDPNLLRPGQYRLDVYLATIHQLQDGLEGVIRFQVASDPTGYEELRYRDADMGVFRVDYRWTDVVPV